MSPFKPGYAMVPFEYISRHAFGVFAMVPNEEAERLPRAKAESRRRKAAVPAAEGKAVQARSKVLSSLVVLLLLAGLAYAAWTGYQRGWYRSWFPGQGEGGHPSSLEPAGGTSGQTGQEKGKDRIAAEAAAGGGSKVSSGKDKAPKGPSKGTEQPVSKKPAKGGEGEKDKLQKEADDALKRMDELLKKMKKKK